MSCCPSIDAHPPQYGPKSCILRIKPSPERFMGSVSTQHPRQIAVLQSNTCITLTLVKPPALVPLASKKSFSAPSHGVIHQRACISPQFFVICGPFHAHDQEWRFLNGLTLLHAFRSKIPQRDPTLSSVITRRTHLTFFLACGPFYGS
jgi:hypothetical protein